MTKTRGICEVCNRTDVPTTNGRLKSHRKDKADKVSQHCSGVGREAK